MDNIEKYQMLMADWASKTLMPHVDRIRAGEEADFAESQVFNTIFTGFTEIIDTYEALEFSSQLLSVASPRSKKIAKERYVKFVVNTYLQDVYILKERMNTYATKIKRMHERIGRNNLVSQHIDPLFPQIKSSFKGIVDTRGAHVHAKRFTDENLSEATSLALIATHSPEFEHYYNFSVHKVKIEWKNRIRRNNEQTLKLLNLYFGELICVVADNGEVIAP